MCFSPYLGIWCVGGGGGSRNGLGKGGGGASSPHTNCSPANPALTKVNQLWQSLGLQELPPSPLSDISLPVGSQVLRWKFR